ncbi:hypothetical protein XELAEV_18037001mg [Xenopus laevis]|uniref:Uncharacterized protein n=1 Tax=Xenopus laevis TaxID=8355 RepID=A0A974CCK2_XENLA|nr:hypothetical protein XELAEV_18037001mg [Xenopus laevis]
MAQGQWIDQRERKSAELEKKFQPDKEGQSCSCMQWHTTKKTMYECGAHIFSDLQLNTSGGGELVYLPQST